MRILIAVVLAFAVSISTGIAFADMQGDVDRATTIVNEFKVMPEQSIPPEVLQNCKGLAIITVGKAGFILSGRGGGGVVVAKTPAGWSSPSSVIIGGAGLGFQIGAQVTDFVLVLNTDSAVQAFAKGGNATLGGDLSVSAGPVGRTAEADVGTVAIYSYSRSKGLFAGVSLEGTVLGEGKETNAKFYGRPITSAEILSGSVPHPATTNALYEALAVYAPSAQTVTTTTTTTTTAK